MYAPPKGGQYLFIVHVTSRGEQLKERKVLQIQKPCSHKGLILLRDIRYKWPMEKEAIHQFLSIKGVMQAGLNRFVEINTFPQN